MSKKKVSRIGSVWKKALKDKYFFCFDLVQIMAKQTLKFVNIRFNWFNVSKRWLNLNVVNKVISILLVIKKMRLLNHYVSFYLKRVGILNTFETVVKTRISS